MYYTNSMKITLKNAEIATEALDILCDRLITGFACDSHYRRNASLQMRDYLDIEGNTIVLPEDFGCYLPEDAENVIPELMQDLATHLSTEAFAFETCSASDSEASWVDGSYADGELKIATTYLPSGDCYLYCPECGELIATMDEYEEGKAYICAKCGEEIDLSDWAPVITEKTFKII